MHLHSIKRVSPIKDVIFSGQKNVLFPRASPPGGGGDSGVCDPYPLSKTVRIDPSSILFYVSFFLRIFGKYYPDIFSI